MTGLRRRGAHAVVGAVVVLTFAAALPGGTLGALRPALAAPSPPVGQKCQTATPTPVPTSAKTSASARPVVLVHGWNSSAAGMADSVAPKLTASLGSGFRLYAFDYGRNSDVWAGKPTVGGCLADFINAVSATHRTAGGDGKVLVLGHSMGGLAARFAAGTFGAGPQLGGLVTMDTPHTGSQWGGTNFATVFAAWNNMHHFLTTDPLPASDSDAGHCLMPWAAAGPALPAGCETPPALPAGVPLTELAGRLTVHRTLFGFGMYDIDMGGDTMVDLGSEQGYLASVPKAQRSASNKLELVTVPCTVPMSALPLEVNLSALGQVTATLFADQAALNTLLAGRYGPSLAGFVIGAYIAGSCAHTKITADAGALATVAASLKAQDAALRTAAQAARSVQLDQLRSAPVPAMCQHPAGRLVNGQLPGLQANGGPDPGYEDLDLGGDASGPDVHLPPVLADLTGDGSGDALAVVHCSAGGVSWPDELVLWGPGPALLTSRDLSAVHPAEHANVQSILREGRDVRVTWGTTQGCCFESTEWTARLHFDGKALQVLDARMTSGPSNPYPTLAPS